MIFSFYSFKGGVGRSLLLAHAGITLAAERRARKCKVLLIDMDLEAPGLDVYLTVEEENRISGFAGLLRGYREQGRDLRWLETHLEDRSFIAPVVGTSNLYFMPSGIKADMSNSQNGGYLEAISDLRSEMPDTESPQAPKEGFFHDLRLVLRDRFTYTLIDSRSGLAEQAYASTLLLSDGLVLCFRLNRANIEGIAPIYGNYLLRNKQCAGSENIVVVPVATPVPARGGIDIEKWISAASEAIFEGKVEPGAKAGRCVPQVQKVFFEPTLELGEKLILTSDGSLREGFSEQTPIVACIRRVAEQIASFNYAKDALQAEKIEQQCLDSGDYKKALTYLLAQVSLEPFQLSHWDRLVATYAPRRETKVEVDGFLNDQIRKWRHDSDCETAKRRLAYSLFAWTRGFGKDQPDAGLERLAECLDSVGADEDLKEQAHILFGQVVEELINRKAATSMIRPVLGTDLSLKVANDHYAAAISIARANKRECGAALLLRARSLVELGELPDALADYDSRLAELAANEEHVHDPERVYVLMEQAKTLRVLGFYDLAFRNLRVALDTEPIDTAVVQNICSLAFSLEMFDFGRSVAEQWKREVPRSALVHWVQAVAYVLAGNFPEASEQIDQAEALSESSYIKVLEVYYNLFKSEFEKACEIVNTILEVEDDNTYYNALRVVCLFLAGRIVPGNAETDRGNKAWKTQAIAAFVQDPGEAQKIIEHVKDTRLSALDKTFLQILKYVFGAPFQDSKGEVDGENIRDCFRKRPLLAVVLRNDLDLGLLRLVLGRLKFSPSRSPHVRRGAEVFAMLREQSAPREQDLPPRDLSARLSV